MESHTATSQESAYRGRVIVRLARPLESYVNKTFLVGQEEATLEPLYGEVYHPESDGPASLDSALDWLNGRLEPDHKAKLAHHRAVLRRMHAVTVPKGGEATRYLQAIKFADQIDRAWGRGNLGRQPSTANRLSVRDAAGLLRRGAFGPRPGMAAAPPGSGLEIMPADSAVRANIAPAIGLRPRSVLALLTATRLPVTGGRARRLRIVRAASADVALSGLEMFTEPVGLPPEVEVEDCYVLHDAPLPQSPCAPPSYHKAPKSLDIVHAKGAFANLNVKPGAGVRVAVLERVGWNSAKSLLNQHVFPVSKERYGLLESLDDGKSFDWDGDSGHAAKTLNVLEVDDCRGIVPGADVKCLSSLWHDAGGRWVTNVANSILNAVLHLSPGDILLIEQQGVEVTFLEEQQFPFVPVESDPAIWQAIRLATDVGISVIEPAGNGGRPIALKGGDSGAIMVGYCDAGPERKRGKKSNYGDRVDCFAWGDITLGGGQIYTGTSSAAAQIAGVATLIQSYYKALHHGKTLSPEQMRALLKHQGIATPPGQDIGVMPNLPAILEKIASGPF